MPFDDHKWCPLIKKGRKFCVCVLSPHSNAVVMVTFRYHYKRIVLNVRHMTSSVAGLLTVTDTTSCVFLFILICYCSPSWRVWGDFFKIKDIVICSKMVVCLEAKRSNINIGTPTSHLFFCVRKDHTWLSVTEKISDITTLYYITFQTSLFGTICWSICVTRASSLFSLSLPLWFSPGRCRILVLAAAVLTSK